MSNEVNILLDRSGSMNSIWTEVISGINGYIAELSDINITVAVFDSLDYDIVRNTSKKLWVPINPDEIVPRAGTPLLDAAGRMIQNILDSGYDRSILVVVTGGEENSSCRYSSTEIKNMTKQLTDRNYEIVFLGANFDKIDKVAQTNFGWNDTSRMAHVKSGNFVGMMGATATSTSSYFSSGTRATNFYDSSTITNASK